MNNCVSSYPYLSERNRFSYIKLLKTLGFPYIHTHYIFLKWAEENRTNNHKKGLILLLVCVLFKYMRICIGEIR